MRTSLLRYTAAAAICLCASFAFAQTPAPSPASPAKPTATAPATKAPAMAKPRSALSQECSKKADAQGLHGKARKKFRSACKRGKA
ncbi:MAG: phosphate starvation-inducible protein PsiF [Hyphomicrobiales bacterium]|nr:phosphate starvation-inducible protein PsiF [Hyphomicrobiales bacterium]MBV8770103.1 phosphate starvation-inducible protein PsiF [Hyphomicrobiales bacterium]MBV9053762.1 phosphate starvation-inducible protein PsiF [Hyphomicrobiales bacterium]MBV9138164.1 phosphate starvation-inducible protein PsiF [Hyphomicrobiales bacterium]MBV9591663.1 phosphate starvation-inducible protein PsiF [Hyphomicrobiales bacterium]